MSGSRRGQNPIDVSVNAIPALPVTIGSHFADRQGRSYVLAFDTGQPDPAVSECPAPEGPTQPAAVVTTRTDDAVTYTESIVRTITRTTAYVLTDGKWEPGVPVVTTGEPVISTPTAGQIATAGLHCTTPVPRAVDAPVTVVGVTATAPPKVTEPADSPVTVLGVTATATAKATTPADARVTVLGVSATANPLPAGASAGEADTSGQAAAGELTGLAALLALGAGFMMRRRRGVV